MHRTEFEKMVESVRREFDEAKRQQSTVWELQDELARSNVHCKNLGEYASDLENENDALRHELDIVQGELEASRARDKELDELSDPFVAAIRDSENAQLQRQLEEERHERWQVEQENKSQREAIRQLQSEIEELRRMCS